MDTDICTKISQNRIKFLIFDAHASILFFLILVFQNIESIIAFIVFNSILTMMANRGIPISMGLRKLSVMITGRKKYRYYPILRKDHLFTN